VSLSPELRQRIYEEERVRLEAQARLREELRLRQQGVALAQPGPPVVAPAHPAHPIVGPAVLEAVRRAVTPQQPATVCVRMVGATQPQVRATIELAVDTTSARARRLAVTKAGEAGATLRRHGLALPAYVEVVSPARWYGVAAYDRDTLKVTWDPCPGRCEVEGTRHVQRCRQ
jgi:hypothetical protein